MTNEEFLNRMSVCAAFAECVQEAMSETGESEWARRCAVARFFGYMDAKFMLHLSQTFGLPLTDFVITTQRELALRVPYDALRLELIGIGKKISSVDSSLKDLRTHDRWPPAVMGDQRSHEKHL